MKYVPTETQEEQLQGAEIIRDFARKSLVHDGVKIYAHRCKDCQTLVVNIPRDKKADDVPEGATRSEVESESADASLLEELQQLVALLEKAAAEKKAAEEKAASEAAEKAAAEKAAASKTTKKRGTASNASSTGTESSS